MVLDALGISLRNSIGDTKRGQKLNHDLVPSTAPLGKVLAGLRQKDRPIRLAGDEARLLQPLDRADHRDVSDTDPPGEIHHACLSGGRDELRNLLNIILGSFRRPVGAGTLVAHGQGGIAPACGCRRGPWRQGACSRLRGAGRVHAGLSLASGVSGHP